MTWPVSSRVNHGIGGRGRDSIRAGTNHMTTARPSRSQLVRAVTASSIGTTIEWYDFFLYGVAAATVFPKKFFPGLRSRSSATLLSFSTYFVGFAARPIGAAIFGHYGDRVGRKALLVTTMMLMGVATMGIGLVPSYDDDRHLGRRAADGRPRAAGPRRRRRVERLGADGRRVDRPEAARFHDELRAVRRAGRAWCWPTARSR